MLVKLISNTCPNLSFFFFFGQFNLTQVSKIIQKNRQNESGSTVLRTCLDWLPGGKPKECLFHSNQN
ncbi:uncharacterized protein BX663DRAFT_527705 [Cokeromyces recurvatus]|uniref:uncharacterized protein n=1 Tax=Cokeromyces recurvatus TaxID=90255 RepID=UPI002221258E|nr:uncharacterized protein BX663DRAFT_527705 [Cokeromyces recurvatus]KAI7897620.1 hypothetical protein BX663DRAFT_527705 [Cokeromyces recurvatus]